MSALATIRRNIMAAILLFIAWKIYCKLYRKYKRLPPGEDGLPFIGCFIHVIILKHKFPIWHANKYSKFITLHYLGKRAFAEIHDSTLARQVLSHPACQDRSPFFRHLSGDEDDVVRVKYGKQWKERRKLIRSTLLTMEDSNFIDENIDIFIKKYTDIEIEESMNTNGYFSCAKLQKCIRHLTFSMIIKVMFGKELPPNDTTFIELEYLYEEWAQTAAKSFIGDFFEFISILQNINMVDQTRKLENELNKKVKYNFFEPSQNKFNSNNKQTYFDYAYEYILNKKSNKNNITLNQLLMDFRILIQASIDTLSFVLEMGILNLIKYKNIQNDIYNELKNEFGNNKKIEIKRIIKCPKFRSYVNEILRIALPVPSGVGRYTIKDIKVLNGKYIIPKGTNVSTNLPFIHYKDIRKWNKNGHIIDLNYWLEMDKNKNELIFKNRKDVLPFGVGMRDCAGRSLALRLLYSIFATMIMKYTFDKYDNDFEIKTKFVSAGSQRTAMECNILIQKR